uniref:EHD_N domain-containing protein n=1 Tax=Anopheles funestus TaxID=62324 RepID=A0A4Y0BKT0_ANOFN
MRRISVWVLLGLALFTLSTAGLQVQAETPTEYECRPYIEKAIQDLKSESAEGADENASIENTIDVTSQEEEDNTAAEEVSTEETDTATDDVSEEITPSEEVQEQLFADKAEDEAAESDQAVDGESENVEETEETEQEDEQEQEDEEGDETEDNNQDEQEDEEDATEENVQSEEAGQTVSEETEQSDDVQTESEELTSEESANQVLDDNADDDDDEDDDEEANEDVATEEVTQSAEEATESQEKETDADDDDDDEKDDEEDDDDDEDETPENVDDETKSEENNDDEDDEEEEDDDDDNDDDEEENKEQNNSEDDEDDDLEEENAVKGSYDDRDQVDDDQEDDDDDDDREEENAVKGSYDDREQVDDDQEDDDDVSAEVADTVSEEDSENDEVVDSSEDTNQNENEDLEGTNSEEEETDKDTDNDDEDEEALTEDSVASGEEPKTEEDEPTSKEVEDDDDDDENLSEETERDTVEGSTAASEEENDEPEPAVDEQSEEQVVDSQEDESAAQDEASTEETADESSEDATTVEDVEATSQEQEEQSAEEPSDGQEAAEESAEEAEAESAEQEAPATDAEDESEEEVAVKQDSEESLAQDGEESVEKASEETDTDSKEESFPEEDLLLEYEIPSNLRDTTHIYELLNINDDASAREKALQDTADVILRDLKRIYDNSIKPLETLYKYRDLSNRHFGDPEIFSKPLVLFMGPWSGGKSTILNYLTHNEYTPNSVRTGAEPSPAYFNILMHGDEPEVLDGTQLAADWTFSGLQKFGQGLLDRLRGQKLPNQLLERVNIVEIPGILEVRKQVSKYFPFNDACQWFIDRADIIFLVYDPSKLDVGPETEAILDQLKGREYQTRILLNKADQVKPEELLRVQSALIWNISPLMSSAQPPVMYTVSLWSNPFEVGAPVRLLQAQERTLLLDLGQAIDRRIENKIASARRFAVRVRNHAKMVDCYLTTYYNHKTLFGNKKQVSEKIIANPQDYHIYEGLSTLTNISRYDLPDPEVYRDFFHLNPLYEFKKLSETCTYFRGCPINKLDVAIAYELPELVGKYKKMSEAALAKLDVLTPTSDFGKGKSNS